MNLLFSILLASTLTSDVPRLQPAELKVLLDKGEAVAVDVRGSVPYELGHIRGAAWMPLGALRQRAGELPEGKLLVTYCTCAAEESSLEGARVLAELGFGRVAVLVGGYPAWKEAGFPIESNREADAEVQPAAAAGASGRLAPPAAVRCPRSELTAYAGKVTGYARTKGATTVKLRTSAETDEAVVVTHPGSDDPSKFFLFEASPFTARHWSRVEVRRGELREGMSAIAWVCRDGRTLIDWRPGAKFTGAE